MESGIAVRRRFAHVARAVEAIDRGMDFSRRRRTRQTLSDDPIRGAARNALIQICDGFGGHRAGSA